MALVVVLSWPVRQVWPNYRQSHHWRSYHKQVKAQREEGWAETLVALEGRQPSEVIDPSQPIRVRVRFIPPDRIRRDDDGYVGAFKSARDGIADALRVDDSLFRVDYEVDATPEKPGRIEVTIG